MSDSEYTPPKVWEWKKGNGGRFANTNRPIAGPTHDKDLPVGKHPDQLYSLATPNGVKVTVSQHYRSQQPKRRTSRSRTARSSARSFCSRISRKKKHELTIKHD